MADEREARGLIERLRTAQVPYDPEIDAQEFWEGLCADAADALTAAEARIAALTADLERVTRERDTLRSQRDEIAAKIDEVFQQVMQIARARAGGGA